MAGMTPVAPKREKGLASVETLITEIRSTAIIIELEIFIMFMFGTLGLKWPSHENQHQLLNGKN